MSSKILLSESDRSNIVRTGLDSVGTASNDQSGTAGTRPLPEFSERIKVNTLRSAAAHLHKLLADSDDQAADAFIASASFNLSVLKELLQLQSLDDDQRAARLKEAEAQLAEVSRKKREQTRKALEVKRSNSSIPKIKAWLLALEQQGENVVERHIAGKISVKFGVTPTHARNIRTEYLSEKAKKAQQSSRSFV